MARQWLIGVIVLALWPLQGEAAAGCGSGGAGDKAEYAMPRDKQDKQNEDASRNRRPGPGKVRDDDKALRDLEKIEQAQREGKLDLQDGIAPGPKQDGCED